MKDSQNFSHNFSKSIVGNALHLVKCLPTHNECRQYEVFTPMKIAGLQHKVVGQEVTNVSD